MVTVYHKSIQRMIIDLGKDLEENGKTVKRVVDGSSRPIHINHPTKRKDLLYKPDAYYEVKDGRIIAFEVLDSQSSEKTIADVTRAALDHNIRQLYLITKDEKSRNDAVEICDVILSRIADSARVPKEDLLPTVCVMKITSTQARNKKGATKLMTDALKKQSRNILKK